jgi:hypothetical protein
VWCAIRTPCACLSLARLEQWNGEGGGAVSLKLSAEQTKKTCVAVSDTVIASCRVAALSLMAAMLLLACQPAPWPNQLAKWFVCACLLECK